jgi:hypothetical protein
MKVHLRFILLLALGAVIDPHVKLRRADVEVESHEEALVEVMVFCKLRLAALEVHLASPIVPDLHFIGSFSPRVFMKNRFPQFSPIHKLSELQRHPLNLTALSVGDAEEGVYSRQRRRSIVRRSVWTWHSR